VLLLLLLLPWPPLLLLSLSQVPIGDHVMAMKTVMDFLSKNVSSNILKEVVAVGHRWEVEGGGSNRLYTRQ
jgi:hypothetical protein